MRRARAVALAGVLLTLAAFAFDAAPLFVPGIAFALVGALTPAWVWLALRRSAVTRRIDAEEIVEHQPVEAVLAIRRGRLGLPGAEIVDAMAREPVQLLARATILRPAVTEIRVVARFNRRGRTLLDPPLLRVRDPLGLARVVRRGYGPRQEVLVLPATEPVAWQIDPRRRRLIGPDAGAVQEPMAAVDVDGLRPYRQGTPASRIHWPALARGHGLLERQLRADGEARPLIVLDVRLAGPPEQLDAAVRATASLTLELARRGGCRLLLPGETRPVAVEPDLRGWPALHVRLALVTPEQASIPQLAALVGAAPVFYVAMRGGRRLPAGVGAGGGARVLIAPTAACPPAGPTPAFTVSGCHGFVLGAARAPGGGRAGGDAATAVAS